MHNSKRMSNIILMHVGIKGLVAEDGKLPETYYEGGLEKKLKNIKFYKF